MDISESRHRSREEKSAATRARLTAAARQLFDEYGYHNVSVTQIARMAGVTHAMINVYFHSKAGLLYALIQENNASQIDKLSDTVPMHAPFEEKLRHIVAVYVKGDLADPRLLAVMQAYYWQWPAETEVQNRLQLRQALAPLLRAMRDAPQFTHRTEEELEDALDAFYAIYSHGLRPSIYDDASIPSCIELILRRSKPLFDGLALAAVSVRE
ncbi:TetR/AcrR family transcriptional regulator [Alloyangia pacifica]|uniref:Transcriptional regulator, TetR family n=1 Tax=Alloyangia pacifica TaxID=311180 RepID=A0A1I6QYG9_9RHOB|nr:TetR/AcrR family transcriptional regulator [Alloyangia pacifica]SDG05324.1 transcriptional regulator, TetR family [Alloyangia pacifica]SFS57463.1 transcriptional regulator, TetR family [Alloyangia pacifica]